MFFMMGITQGRKDLNYNYGAIVCDHCGSFGRYQVFMTYMVLSLFFIPCFKWNKEYYVQSSCCGTIYALDPAIGKRIAAGEDVEILPAHLTKVQSGRRGGFQSRGKRCGNCGYETVEDFDFCPKCGNRF